MEIKLSIVVVVGVADIDIKADVSDGVGKAQPGPARVSCTGSSFDL